MWPQTLQRHVQEIHQRTSVLESSCWCIFCLSHTETPKKHPIVLLSHFPKSIPLTFIIRTITTSDELAETHCGTNIIASSQAHITSLRSAGTKSLWILQRRRLPETNQSRNSFGRLPAFHRWKHSGSFITIKRLIYVKCERNANRTSASGLVRGCQRAVTSLPLHSETSFGEMIQQMVPIFCFVKNSSTSSLITVAASGALGRTRENRSEVLGRSGEAPQRVEIPVIWTSPADVERKSPPSVDWLPSTVACGGQIRRIRKMVTNIETNKQRTKVLYMLMRRGQSLATILQPGAFWQK